MRLNTAVGTVVVKTNWEPLRHFMSLRRSSLPPCEEREVVVHVTRGAHAMGDLFPDDPPDAYPRRLCVMGCEFIVSRDAIRGVVPQNVLHVGLVVEWLWYALAVLCCPDGWEAVHAAAVETDEGATLVFGAPGAGKTYTVLEMMAQRNVRYFSDDIVLVSADGAQARGWDNTLHVDTAVAARMGRTAPHIDFCGKVRILPPALSRRMQAPIAKVYKVGTDVKSTHVGPGFDSEWVRNYGAGNALIAVASAVDNSPLDITVAIVNRDPYKPPTKWDGGDMTHVWGYVHGLQKAGVRAKFIPYRDLDESTVDLIHLIHSQTGWAREVARNTTKPLIVSAITQNLPELPTRGDVEAAVGRAHTVLCFSETEEEWYAAMFPELPREKFRSVPMGVPAEMYREHEAILATRSVFMAGRYHPKKNQLAVLRACKELGVPVTFAGFMDRDSMEYLKQMRQTMGDWSGARMLGILKGEDLWSRYRAAHVHAQPSQFESFGLSTWEALACGCNVVAPANGWGRPYFDEYGTTCGPDVQDVKRAIEYELRLPRNRHNFHPPTWEQASRALIPIYREALA